MLMGIYTRQIKTVYVLIIFMIILNSACQTAQATQANIEPTILPTQTQVPTSTFTPVPSPTTTATPYPPLAGNKPYFMIRPDRESQKFVIYDANGSGRKIIELPSGGNIQGGNSTLSTIVSPDGQWLVFYTGDFGTGNTPDNLPITLKILNINDGTIKRITDVVTNGYQDKLSQLVDKLKKINPDYYNQSDNLYNGLLEPFKWGVYSTAWSSDSHKLAFAAQLDGLSSDVYVYDVEADTIQRAEDSLQSVSRIRWSLNGKKIIFENNGPMMQGYMGPSELHVINLAKNAINNPPTLYWGNWLGDFDNFTQTWIPSGDWLSPNILLVTGQTPDAGPYGIEALNINTGYLFPLWQDSYGGYAIDKKNKIIAVGPSDFTHPENLGLYFISFNGRKTKIIDGFYYFSIFFRNGEKHRFLIHALGGNPSVGQFPMSGGVVGMGLDGKPIPLGQFNWDQISISPDYAWLLMYDTQKLYLYDQNDELIKTFPIDGIKKIFWRPDSQAIFYITDTGLYTLSIPDGNAKLVDNANVKDAVWLP